MAEGGTESRPGNTRTRTEKEKITQEDESDRGTTEFGSGTHKVDSGANQVVRVGESSVFQTRVVTYCFRYFGKQIHALYSHIIQLQ